MQAKEIPKELFKQKALKVLESDEHLQIASITPYRQD